MEWKAEDNESKLVQSDWDKRHTITYRKRCLRLFQANPTEEMPTSGSPRRVARRSTGDHFCQSEWQGTVEKRSLVAGGVTFDILHF